MTESTRGGVRPGAGRPKEIEGEVTKLSATMPVSLIAYLDEAAAAWGVKRSAALRRIVEDHKKETESLPM